MWYVTFVCEYPIFEPAEGGYYYAGTTNEWVREFQTWRKARQFFNKAVKEFISYYGGETDYNGKDRVTVNHRWHYAYYSAKYIGEGRGLYLSRKPEKERGWVPYE